MLRSFCYTPNDWWLMRRRGKECIGWVFEKDSYYSIYCLWWMLIPQKDSEFISACMRWCCAHLPCMIWLMMADHKKTTRRYDKYLNRIHIAVDTISMIDNDIEIVSQNTLECTCIMKLCHAWYDWQLTMRCLWPGALTLKVLVMTIDAQWEGMGDVGSARYEPALLPPCPTIRV